MTAWECSVQRFISDNPPNQVCVNIPGMLSLPMRFGAGRFGALLGAGWLYSMMEFFGHEGIVGEILDKTPRIPVLGSARSRSELEALLSHLRENPVARVVAQYQKPSSDRRGFLYAWRVDVNGAYYLLRHDRELLDAKRFPLLQVASDNAN